MIYCSIALAVLAIGLHLILTPVNTWGVNSLDNSLVQHATAVQNTMNQIAGALGTALVVSISALALYVFPTAPTNKLAYLGDHLALNAIFALSTIIFLLVLFFLRGNVK